MRTILVYGLTLLLALCYKTAGQVEGCDYCIYYGGDAETYTHRFQIVFDEDSDELVVQIHVEGDTWAGIGFAASGSGDPGTMAGVDSWIFGDFGSGADVYEYTLGVDNIGDLDPSQDFILKSVYPNGPAGTYDVTIRRAYDTGNREDYTIVYGGDFCVIWAIGYSLQVETGHANTTRGYQCFELPGTTNAPTPSPTYFPTPAPSDSPHPAPTKFPTVAGETQPPTKSPSDRPSTSPTTSAPSISPSRNPTREPGSPTKAPTPAPTKPPTADQLAPTMSPATSAPTMSPTDFDDNVPEETDPSLTEEDSGSDDLQQLFLILFIVLGVLICLLLATICYCYEHNRRLRQKKNKEKEEAYEKMENYRAEHGLDIPDNANNQRQRDIDNDNNQNGATAGNIAPSHRIGSDDSDDLEKDDELTDILNGKEPPPAYANAIGGGAAQAEKQRRQREKRGPKHRDNKANDYDDDDTVMDDINNTPGGPAVPENNITPNASGASAGAGAAASKARKGKFVDENKARREQIRRERKKRVEDRAKLTQNQTSESLRKQKGGKSGNSSPKQEGNGDDNDDDYDYEAARKEREERKRRREARRARAKKKQGKFGVFDEDNW